MSEVIFIPLASLFMKWSPAELPFEGDNTVAVALAHLEEAVTPPSQLNPMVSRGLEEIILKCTQKSRIDVILLLGM
mgnify:CR=1 FL=1